MSDPPAASPGPDVRARARRLQQVEALCAASIRALSGQPDLHYRARRLHLSGRPLPPFAAHLHPQLEDEEPGSLRGAADGLALRLLHSDPALHERLSPDGRIERLLFDVLEQLRAESLVPPGMPGVAHNLRQRFEAWSLGVHHSGQTETASGLLIYTVLQICRSRLTGEAVTAATEDLLEATRAALVPQIGIDLAGLKRERADQGAAAPHALAIARRVAELLEGAGVDGRAGQAGPGGRSRRSDGAANALLSDLVPPAGAGSAGTATARRAAVQAEAGAYRVYTRDHDRELAAQSQVRPPVLRAHRQRLDERIASQGINPHRLARELQALLAEPLREGWDDALEEGRIDGRRLARLVASPHERRVFLDERSQPRADAVFSFVIDCSGSMKEHSLSVAMLVDVFVRALEQAGVPSEVLGYSTGAWNGGRAARDWQRAGRPPQPGRLNERLHLVFKDADTPWRRARPGLAALLEGSLYREGLDGEAIDWACQRLLARGESRKLLVAVSDGSPMDSATGRTNDPHYLDRHLSDVVARHERAGRVRLHGLGVGLDLSPYYRSSRVFDLDIGSGHQPFRELIELLARRRT